MAKKYKIRNKRSRNQSRSDFFCWNTRRSRQIAIYFVQECRMYGKSRNLFRFYGLVGQRQYKQAYEELYKLVLDFIALYNSGISSSRIGYIFDKNRRRYGLQNVLYNLFNGLIYTKSYKIKQSQTERKQYKKTLRQITKEYENQ